MKLRPMNVVLAALQAVSLASGGGAGLSLEAVYSVCGGMFIVVDDGLDDNVRIGLGYGFSQDARGEQ